MPLYVVEFVDLPYSSLLCLTYELIGVLERTKIFINKMTILCRLIVAIALKKKKASELGVEPEESNLGI